MAAAGRIQSQRKARHPIKAAALATITTTTYTVKPGQTRSIEKTTNARPPTRATISVQGAETTTGARTTRSFTVVYSCASYWNRNNDIIFHKQIHNLFEAEDEMKSLTIQQSTTQGEWSGNDWRRGRNNRDVEEDMILWVRLCSGIRCSNYHYPRWMPCITINEGETRKQQIISFYRPDIHESSFSWDLNGKYNN